MSHIDINVCSLLTSATFYSNVCSPITTIICTECKYTFVPLAYSAETPCRASFFSRSLNACWGLPASTQRLLEESQVAPCYHRSHTRGCPLEQKTARATSSKSNVAVIFYYSVIIWRVGAGGGAGEEEEEEEEEEEVEKYDEEDE